jgi:DUF1009 family protein
MTEPTEARRLAEELATEFHPHEEFCEKDRCVCEQVAKDFRDFLTERVEKVILAGIVWARQEAAKAMCELCADGNPIEWITSIQKPRFMHRDTGLRVSCAANEIHKLAAKEQP